MNKVTEFVNQEMEFRMRIVEDAQFIKDSIKMAKRLGITAQEWNENKAVILLTFANEMVSIDNKNGGELRTKLMN